MSYKTALIPAAGRGARLDRPGTPKALIDVGGTPLIVRLLQQLESVGVERALIVLGYRGDQIERALTHHPDVGIALEFVKNEHWQDGLASSVLAVRAHVNEPFLLAMADHFFDHALVERMAQVTLHGDTVAALVDRRIEAVFDLESAVKARLDEDRVLACGRRLADANAVDAGLFATTPKFLNAMNEVVRRSGDAADLTDTINEIASSRRVRAVDVKDASWIDIDTPASLVVAEMAYRHELRVEQVKRPKEQRRARAIDQNYGFTVGGKSETAIYLQRGFVRDPSLLDLIPESSSSSPIFVFTDVKVNKLYGNDFVGGLASLGYDVHRIVLSEGEESKTLANYTRLVEDVIGKGIDEASVLISLGGGAVCNVCGFLASTLYRGIRLIHVPTTLMAQCDAAISHKQGVNGARGKNLVGSYYSPLSIAVDVEVLATLDDWLVPDGLSEVVKHALGQDIDYIDYLLAYGGDIRDPDFLERVVRRNIELKCGLMADDPKEYREAMVLQYGHTVGHPVEYLSGYDLYHGQAVAIGMMAAVHVSRVLGGCDSRVVDLHEHAIAKFGLPTTIPPEIGDDDIIMMMKYNKRYLKEGTRMALVDRPGHLWSVESEYAIPVSEQVLREALKRTRTGTP